MARKPALTLRTCALLAVLATLATALPALCDASALVFGDGKTSVTPRDRFLNPDTVPMADDHLGMDAIGNSVQIKWGKQLPLHSDAATVLSVFPGVSYLRASHCFGGHGISDRFFDKAVEVFCGKVNGKVLSMKADNTSYAMMSTYRPPAMHGGKHPDDCGDTGSVYLHIGFGLGAPTDVEYTLSNETCTRGLSQVYTRDCGWDITDNKQGGQLDFGSYTKQGSGANDTYNDHLFYLADPNPPLPGRNRFCSNLERFVPNAEDTYTFPTFFDPCYEFHEGYSGDDFWFRDPPEWAAKGMGRKEHDEDKARCVRGGGIYDKRGGTRDNDGRKDGQ